MEEAVKLYCPSKESCEVCAVKEEGRKSTLRLIREFKEGMIIMALGHTNMFLLGLDDHRS